MTEKTFDEHGRTAVQVDIRSKTIWADCWFVSCNAIVSRLWGMHSQFKPKYSGSGLLVEANMHEAGPGVAALALALEFVLHAVYRDCIG
jgi:hypothetical protein